MGKPVRLDIGAGNKREEGWISLDIAEKDQPDVRCDLRKIPLPYGCADEIRAVHIVEHFYPWEALDVLKEWSRLLKPKAEIAIECPCLDKIIKLFDVPNVPPQFTYWGLYGDPRYQNPLMTHHWCYSEGQLSRLMLQAGLVNIRSEPVRFHVPVRDMRLVGQAPTEETRIVLPTDQ